MLFCFFRLSRCVFVSFLPLCLNSRGLSDDLSIEDKKSRVSLMIAGPICESAKLRNDFDFSGCYIMQLNCEAARVSDFIKDTEQLAESNAFVRHQPYVAEAKETEGHLSPKLLIGSLIRDSALQS